MYPARISSLLGKITTLLIICCCTFSAQAKYGGGTGEPNDPYLIYDANQMNAIGANRGDWDKHFKLMENIDLSAYTGTQFNIIGTSYRRFFSGVFDGNSHTISNFTYTSMEETMYVGIFGYVKGTDALVKDLGLIASNVQAESGGYVCPLVGRLQGTISGCYVLDANVVGRWDVGGLVGWNEGGTISSCYSTGSVSAVSNFVGGLVGHSYGTITDCYSTSTVSGTGRSVGGLVGYATGRSTITDCYATGDVAGANDVGGLVGYNSYEISNCYSRSTISGTGPRVGGLVGDNSGAISNCYSEGDVSGPNDVGGLVGENDKGTISNCYSGGDVSGDDNIGGLVGGNVDAAIINCYATTGVSGDDNVGGLVGLNTGGVYVSFWDIQTSEQTTSAGGIGKTTAQMKDPNTYFGWGCGLVWTIDAGVDYPRLVWENKPGQLITAQFSDSVAGNGTKTDPYLIYTAQELNSIGLFVCERDKHFLLCADIDMNAYTGTSFNIIGNFTGVFDGNSHTISNFTYTSTDTDNIGLFGCIDDPNAEIKDLRLVDPNLDAGIGGSVGLLVGSLIDGTITNCHAEGGSVSGGASVGGLVGSNDYGTITNSTSSATVSRSEYCVGGLVGSNSWGTISNSYSTGSASAERYVGGLVGYDYYGTITNCYSTATVSGDRRVGGLVGYTWGTISNCYSTGGISGYEYVGGLVGYSREGTITNCYSAATVSGDSCVGGLVGYTRQGTITDCNSGGSVTGENNIGGLVGENWVGTITYCYSTGSVTGGTRYIGGLVGRNYDIITNCYSVCSVSGNYQVGGVVGDNDGTITNCYSEGGVSGNSKIGGLVGNNDGTIRSCCSSEGSVSGTSYVGGLVGINWATITNCYAEGGSISGHNCVGGLVGYNYESTITNCYSTSSVSGTSYVGGLVGYDDLGAYTSSFWDNIVNSGLPGIGNTSDPNAIGESTANMQSESTFTNAGWDFVGESANGTENIWRLCNEGVDYAKLAWEFPIGDFLCPDGVDFSDYSFFVLHWQKDNCGASSDCEGTDLDQFGTVDINDLVIFVDHWLAGPLPGRACNPNPPNGAKPVGTLIDLSWTAASDATSHDVYFGTSSPPPFIRNQTATILDPGTMDLGTTYYWRIDERNVWGKTNGIVWSFTTTTMPPPP